MKTVKLFYLENCPFCRRALEAVDAAKSAHPELAAVAVECIEESKQPDVAERYDYYYVPTFYIDGRKVHGCFADGVGLSRASVRRPNVPKKWN